MRPGCAPRRRPPVASARSQIVARPVRNEKLPTLLPLCQVKPSIDAVQEELNGFISAAEQPALVEPGQEPLPLVAGAYVLEQSAGRLFVEVWTRDRTLSRRITGVLAR